MPDGSSTFTDLATAGSTTFDLDSNGMVMCDAWEPRRDSEPAIVPSLLFTDEEAAVVDWAAVYAQW